MAETTHIEWTDATWNPITGCSVVSPGCTNCYAMRLAGTRLRDHPSRAGLTAPSKAGPVWTGEVRFNEGWLDQPLRWRRPRRVFAGAHTDMFHEGITDAMLDRVFGVMATAHWHTFQVLTKRTARMRAYLNDPHRPERMMDAMIPHPTGLRPLWELADAVVVSRPLPNVWLGMSAEDQPRFDERIGDLQATPAFLRFISFEPLLAAIDARGRLDGIRWAIVGGENGPRPTHPDWVRDLLSACADADVDFFFKQWGTHAWAERVEGDPSTLAAYRAGKKAAGRLLDGVQHDAMPEVA